MNNNIHPNATLLERVNKTIKNDYSLICLVLKLLASDIRRERNMVLQCIRHIINNDFFGLDEK